MKLETNKYQEKSGALILFCTCGAGLKKVSLDKDACTIRRRCPECLQRWKIRIKYLLPSGITAEFQKMGQNPIDKKSKKK